MFKKLLVPVDLAETELSRVAIDRAVELAKAGGAELRLVYVRSVMPVSFMEFVPPNFDAEQQGDAEKRLADIAAKVQLPKQTVSTAVRMGGVYPEVLAEATAWKADLVVLGSHRPSMSSYLLGSNATAIVRHAKCSVMVVRT
jgi:nucleotide-binding universal stress UspA family protein